MFNIQTQITLASAQAETILQAWLNRPVTCTEIVPLKGGMINTVLRLAFDQPPYKAVIKLNTPGASGPYALDKEAAILRYLRDQTHFPCPQVYAQDSTENRHGSEAREVRLTLLVLDQATRMGRLAHPVRLAERDYG